MKKIFKNIAFILSFVSLLNVMPPIFAAEAEEYPEYTYVAYMDTYVDCKQKELNFGSSNNVLASCAKQENAEYSYFSFDFSKKESDDPLVLEPANPKLGFWYEADITGTVKKKYNSSDKRLHLQIVPKYISNANIKGTFYSRESQVNRPHIKVRLDKTGKKVVEAKFYFFGGTPSTSVCVNELKSDFDEMTVTYNNKPLVGASIGTATRNAEMSGRPEAVNIETINGLTMESAMSTTMPTYESIFTDEPTWDEVYDTKQIPLPTEIFNKWKTIEKDVGHPRILGNEESWARIRKWYDEGNEFVVNWADRIISVADNTLDVEIEKEFKISPSTGVMGYKGANIIEIAMAYQITLDEKYARNAYEKLAIVANYSHWNAGANDLNVGDTSYNVSVSLDLIYNALTEEERDVVIAGILKNALQPKLGKPNTSTNNWNCVTNGGLGIAAMVVMDKQPHIAAEILSQSIGAIPISLLEYYPDGSFPEGLGYWDYMSRNFFRFAFALKQIFGTTYGLCEFEGVPQTGYFPIYMNGPTKEIRFKYGDDSLLSFGSPIMSCISRIYDNYDFEWFLFDFIEKNEAWNLLAPYWCAEDSFTRFEKEKAEHIDGGYRTFPLDRMFEGQTSAATMRSAWNDPNALFVGLKGSFPMVSHVDLDIGTFIISALGVEWSHEFYPDFRGKITAYPSLSRMTRYIFYCASPQGHNTLFFNPGSLYPDFEYGQETKINSKFEKFYSAPDGTYAILDMSDAYRKYASSVKRGIALINNRREFLVQDEIKTGSKNLTYWFMQTLKDFEVSGNEAILTDGNKRLYCRILSPSNATFEKLPATALPNTATISDYDDVINKDISKLAIKTEIEGDQKITVWMVPLTEFDDIPKNPPAVTDFKNWPLPQKEMAAIDSVTINGVDFKEFSPNKLVYDVATVAEEFNVVAAGDENTTLKTTVKDSGVMIECSAPGKSSSRYVFNYIRKTDLSKIKIEASDSSKFDNPPEATLDGDVNTYWNSSGLQWIKYDLGEFKYLNGISLAFNRGNIRMYNFKVEVSEDDMEYRTLFDGSSSGLTSEAEFYPLDTTKIRYVRITCNGNNTNDMNNVSEVIFSYADDDDSAYEQEE